MNFRFVTDKVVQDKAYPALARWWANPYTTRWREFVHHWPYTVPCELHEHCKQHGFDYSIVELAQGQPGDLYTIGLGFFDFDIDYFDLIPAQVFERKLVVLFYYHEGDNPYKIRDRLDYLCKQHALDPNCYRFVSGNSAADAVPRFAWFPDHELLYWQRNQQTPATAVNLQQRPYEFTILNRTHKWWRATIMADLQRHGMLDHSQWSYNTQIQVGDKLEDNPLQIDVLNLRQATLEFMQQGPYRCDNLTADQHNDHHLHVPGHYTHSYCHVVLETHFDADSSGGTFLTEKTFKPIKHGQPFVIAGPPGSLAKLRQLGYRTFDHVIDHTYDLEPNNTRRWQKLLGSIKQLQKDLSPEWFQQCVPDIEHNQRLFCHSKWPRLNMLHQKLLLS